MSGHGPASHGPVLRLVQRQLEQFYELEQAPDVVDFVRFGQAGSREMLLLQQRDDALEVALVLPPGLKPSPASDSWLQLAEGVSHFVYIAERARTGLPATQLELELQAEVDKFVLLALGAQWIDARATRRLLARLYERVRYLHSADSEAGARYRIANDLAARFVARLVGSKPPEVVSRTLRQFYRSGQSDKIRLARAA